MVNWQFWRRPTPARILRLRPRGELTGAVRVEFQELAPDVRTFLGQAAYLQLGYFETLTRLIRATPDLAEKEALSLAAGAALRKHRGIIDVIRDGGDDPTELMLPFQEQLDAFRRETIGARPRETMLTVHITAGMLDDFYLALASGYGETGRRVARVLRFDHDRQQIAQLLVETIGSDEEWRSLLSMWARRLVGDTLLVARAALRMDAADEGARTGDDVEKVVEPVFTALMAAHARRMDALGLAA
ncbi:ferritin-like fold-containing protein [Microbacterium betulae]|uniref:Ferritin-like fold-containing protein n=1 Tax=Microbacterium betulae TaxID=2981139 RepID=A0AA97FKF3_9MICO|nr:ferritin-like fold-containing protein [Microbacterium sp. AB]WOF24454.1 ferritin-like fold-containing protein [Microbacterium sp. AB]